MSDIIERYRRRIPLRIRLKVIFEMKIQNYLIERGYVPDGYWNDEKEEKFGNHFRKLAKEMADTAIEEFEEWEKDGRPIK